MRPAVDGIIKMNISSLAFDVQAELQKSLSDEFEYFNEQLMYIMSERKDELRADESHEVTSDIIKEIINEFLNEITNDKSIYVVKTEISQIKIILSIPKSNDQRLQL